MGLVSEVVADDQTLERANTLAKEIARLPALALEHIKETVLTGWRGDGVIIMCGKLHLVTEKFLHTMWSMLKSTIRFQV